MEKQIFKYKGKELAIPLNKLMDAIAKKKGELAKLLPGGGDPDSVNEYAAKFNQMEKIGNQTYVKFANNLSAFMALRDDYLKAYNWLRECQRQPRVCYVLDFEDLNWLYSFDQSFHRQQIGGGSQGQ